MIGLCWSCGRFGHLAANCVQNKKWYPFSRGDLNGLGNAGVLQVPNNKVCGVNMANKQLSEYGKQGSVTAADSAAANSAAENSLSTNDNPMVNSPDMPDQI